MLERKSKPFSYTDSNGKTTEFATGSEFYLFMRKYHSKHLADMDNGIDYDKWEGEGSCTKEELEKCYSNSSLFPQGRTKKKVEATN